MDLDDLRIGDRLEIYTPSVGTYWGFLTAIGDLTVDLDDIAPDGPSHKPGRERASKRDIVRRVDGVRKIDGVVVRRG